ncbi:M14 family metallopeptidase [Salibacterium aidingense]|uniref:M14 family metallopeptidase n=1 Tax=Salibacterium aidingense TaxID=384933 RepID=UPI00040CEBF3|nr:M14 family metallopeptidase [Salibacterium aidingense]
MVEIAQYKTERGDTFAKLAYRHQVEEVYLRRLNHLSSSMYLKPGTVVEIPEQKGSAPYEKKGECLYEYGWRELEADRQHYLPGIASEKIGTSVLGKPIWSFRIGKGKKKVFFSAAWHGNEWLNTWLLMRFLQELQVKNDSRQIWHGIDICMLLREVTLFVVPLVNPDGVEIVQEGAEALGEKKESILQINGGMMNFQHWSANAAGVDLNHQWPAGWKEEARESPDRPFPRHYGGEAPLTEPEAKAVYQLTMEEEFSQIIALHSQGEEIYWGYRRHEPEGSEELAARLARASSFKAIRTADSKAGYKDWFIKTFRRPGFTVETGIGQNPLPMEASARIWVTSVPLLLESCTFPDYSSE